MVGNLKHLVFLIGDTARTIETSDKNSVPEKEYSTFGERSLKDKIKIVEEFQNKCYRINGNVGIAYAGITDLALDILKTYERCFEGDNIIGSFQKAIDACRNGEIMEVQFLVGYIENATPKLYGYNIESKNELKGQINFASIGSLKDTSYALEVEDFPSKTVKGIENDNREFYLTLGFLRHKTIHNYLFEHSAGGFFCGLRIDVSGVSWVEDSTYMLYDLTMVNSQDNVLTQTDWRKHKLKFERCILPNEIEMKCIDIVETFGLSFGAIDLIRTPEDEYIFFEINPNGQWTWIEKDTMLPISQEIINFLVS